MAPDVRKQIDNNAYLGNSGSSRNFSISLDDLKKLMQNKTNDAVTQIESLGGVNGLCEKLKTDPNNGKYIVFK